MRNVRRLLEVVVGLLLLGLIVYTVPRFALDLHPPHTVSLPAAKLDDELAAHVDEALSKAPIKSTNDAVAASLAITGDLVDFGLEHPQTLAFSVAKREANCVEYSHLFAHIFNQAAKKADLRAAAYVVHSENARLLGVRVPARGFQDHDWVLIEEHAAAPDGAAQAPGSVPRRVFVDPTLHDAWLGWDIERAVQGDVKLPAGGR